MRSPDRRLGKTLSGPTWAGTFSLSNDPPKEDTDAILSCAIVWPPDGKLRARRIISRSRSIATGKYPSLTLGRWVHWESHVERDGVRLADVCAEVTSFCEQPLTIEFERESGWERHVPDLLIHGYLPRPCLIEFKRDDDPKLEEARTRGRLLAPWLSDLGYDYRLILGSTLRRDSYLENAKWLTRYGRRQAPLISIEFTRRLFEQKGRMTLDEVVGAFPNRLQAFRVLARLIVEGQVEIDMSLPIGGSNRFAWVESGNSLGSGTWLRAAFGETK